MECMWAPCIHREICEYALPMFVGFNNPRFKYARNGYVSIICIPNQCERYRAETPVMPLPPRYAELEHKVEEYRGLVNHLRNEVAELKAKKRGKSAF